MTLGGNVKLTGRKALVGEIRPPGDKSISHRSIILSMLASGRSEIFGISRGQDVLAGIEIARQLGADVTDHGSRISIEAHGLNEPSSVLNVGNSGTLMRLLTGVLAPRDGLFVLNGDESVNSRPMGRVLGPLKEMGATITGRRSNTLAPVSIVGSRLHGGDFSKLPPSAQVKSAILFAGLRADSPTTVTEAVPTRPHTEEMLLEAGAGITIVPGPNGVKVTVTPTAVIQSKTWRVQGDTSQAAFWVVGGLLAYGSELLVKDVLVHPTRSGFVEVLRRMGAKVDLHPLGPRSSDISMRFSQLTATSIGGEEVASMIDEIPVLAIAAARAEGTTVIRDAAELRLKETDRISTTCEMLRNFGVVVEEFDDGMAITGSDRPFLPATIQSHGDHRIAMSAAIGSLLVDGETEIIGSDCVSTSYPSFFTKLGLLTV